MLLHNFLQQYVLIENTHNLFDYSVFAKRFETRYGKRVIRDDYTPVEIQDVAQNTINVNLTFFTSLSEQVLNPFKTWNKVSTTDRTYDGTDTITPDLTDTTTHDLTDTITHSGTVTDEGDTHADGTKNDYINAFNSETSKPRENNKSHSESGGKNTTTYDNSDTNKHDGTTTVVHSGTDTTTRKRDENETYTKAGFNTSEYVETLRIYYSFIDIIIDYVAKDILYVTVREEDI